MSPTHSNRLLTLAVLAFAPLAVAAFALRFDGAPGNIQQQQRFGGVFGPAAIGLPIPKPPATSAPQTRPAAATAAPAAAGGLRPAASAPATAFKQDAAITWNKLEAGCTVDVDKDVFHITGMIAANGPNQWNGVTTSADFPEGSFTVSAEFKILDQSAPNIRDVCLRYISDDGTSGGIHFKSSGYSIQSPPGRPTTTTVKPIGDESTAFHRLSLHYDSATTTLRAQVDSKLVGLVKAGITGKRQFMLVCTADRAQTKMDVIFQNFKIVIGDEAVAAAARPPAPTVPPPHTPNIDDWYKQRGRDLEAVNKPAQTLYGQTDGIGCLVFSPDGKTLASGSGDHTIRLWNVDSGATLKVLQGHREAVLSLEYSPDGKKLLSADNDGRTIVWDTQTGGVSAVLEQQYRASVARFLPGEKQVVVAHGVALRVWNVAAHSSVVLPVNEGIIRSMAVTAQGKVLVGSDSDVVALINPSTGKIEKSHHRTEFNARDWPNAIGSIQVLKGDRALLCDTEGVWMWDLQKDQITLVGPLENGACALAFADEKLLAVGDGYIAVSSMQLSPQVPLGSYNAMPMAIAASPKGDVLAAARGGGIQSGRWWSTDGEPIFFYKRQTLEESLAIVARQPPSGLPGAFQVPPDPQKPLAPWQ